MKKILYSIMMIAFATFTFTSCEDVPAPYEIPSDSDDDNPTEEVQPSGSGTLSDPYNCAAAIKYTSALEANAKSDNDIYIKGKIVSISQNYDDTDYGTASFYISDDGTSTNQFLVWRAYYFNNKKYSSGDIPQVGDEVIIYGKVTNYYGNTPETVQNGAYLYSLNGKTSSDTPDTPSGDILTPTNGVFINESFASSFGVFTAKTVKGTAWVIDFSTAKATGYDSSSKTTTPSSAYLVSKPMDMSSTTAATISFQYILRYYTNYGTVKEGIADKVLITSNYTDDPSTTTWTDITGTLTEGSDWTTFSNYSVAVPSEFLGKEKVVVALYYACEDNSATWEVKNFKVAEGNGGESSGGDDNTGDQSATNGNFESWSGGVPTNWKSTSSASNADLSQSTDAHSGSYSVKVGGNSSANKRLSYKELTLQPGEYTMTFYVKAATSTGASVRPGYATVVNGSISGGDAYQYGSYVNDISSTEWTLVTHTFTISAEDTYCVLIMNAKKPGGDVLIDDFKLVMGSTTIIE